MIAPADRSSERPDWIDDHLVEETKAVWSPRYGRSLTTAEAVEILLSFGRLIDAIEERKP